MTTAFAISNNNLLRFETSAPDRVSEILPVRGLGTGERLVGIDFRPQNGWLYGLSATASGDVRLYSIDFRSGLATLISPAPISLSIPATSFGFDFNPTVDRIRVVTNQGQNFRLNPNTGTLIDGNDGSTMDVPGINLDGSIRGSAMGVDGTAYTNNSANVRVTTQYTLDATTNQLLIQNPPNSGTQSMPLPITLNNAPLDFTDSNGFDIPEGVDVSTANAPARGLGFAILNRNNLSGLYSIELSNGRATFLGTIGNGTLPIQGFAIPLSGGFPIVGISQDGATLVRTNTRNIAEQNTVSLTGLTQGEVLVGIDFRPATGQLFGLGINADANNGTLYLIDPQTGSLTPVATPSNIAFVDGAGNPIDLPSRSAGYGFDFNPTVDRIRVTTGTGLNFRLNPITGGVVDGDANLAGNNPDGAINGLPRGISGTAYTNSSGGATATTQFTLDPDTDSLFIQNPPNAGTQTNRVGLFEGIVGAPRFNFTAVGGFDIPPGVRVTTSNSPVIDLGFATLTVGNSTNLYSINLISGTAINFGPLDLGALTLGDSRGFQFFDTTGDGTPTQPFDLSTSPFIGLPVRGLGGNDNILGTNGNDRINGNQGNDTITGGEGNDLLRGGRDSDRLDGGPGNDTLVGDLGRDTLIGGMGSDLFILRAGAASASSPTEADVVVDFNFMENDRIGLTDGLTFSNLTLEPFMGMSTVIRSGGEFLGILQGVSPNTPRAENFVTFSSLAVF